MIEFKNVWFAYDPREAEKQQEKTAVQADWGNAPDSLWALSDISFSLHDGEFFGIAGHTGSGKSTLVRHMNGLLNPTRGQVLVDGVDIANKQAASEARAHVGLVFQYPERQLFAANVYEDVAFGPRNMGMPETEMDTIVSEALAQVDLSFDELRDKSPFELSGGQQRRVALAGVLAMKPTTLILDEPAAGLDPAARRELLSLIKRLHTESSATIVLISHNMDNLAQLCDRILVLNTGMLYALGTPAEVFADAQACRNIGLDVPAAQRLANALIAEGVELDAAPGGLYTSEVLVDAITAAYERGCATSKEGR
ncbi:MAG: energy-coupling factor transporter ATPase [Eggerthellaceae bacterium]|nr:energy-coupling factor transporter ATPase [Eggerthellaceae bacterium]